MGAQRRDPLILKTSISRKPEPCLPDFPDMWFRVEGLGFTAGPAPSNPWLRNLVATIEKHTIVHMYVCLLITCSYAERGTERERGIQNESERERE